MNFHGPTSAFSDGTKLYVGDQGNNRVLIWNTIPTADVVADVVLGQINMTSSNGNWWGANGQLFQNPTSVYSDGTRLYVADNSNNRVLIWNSLPTTNDTAADVVVGQPDMTSTGGNVTSQALASPSSVYSDGTKLYVADNGNDRVPIWNTIPTGNNAAADVVVGQPDMTSNSGGLSSQSFASAAYVYSDGTKLYVADTGNSRVLIWNAIPTGNFAAASVVVGQPNMTTSGGATTSQNLNYPGPIYSDGTKLYVGDVANFRVLIWNTIPTGNFAAANVVLGQPNMTSSTQNNGGVSSQSLSNPSSVYSDGTKLYVLDSQNNRALIWNTIPTVTQAAANMVLGTTRYDLF